MPQSLRDCTHACDHVPEQKKVVIEAAAGAFLSVRNSPNPAEGSPRLTGGRPGTPLPKSPSLSSTESDVVAEVVVEAGVIACHVCSNVAARSNKPDDTDSFTPRCRFDASPFRPESLRTFFCKAFRVKCHPKNYI
jgi:hypothetical protein